MTLVGGVVELDAVLLGAGFGLLAPWLRGRRALEWATYSGLALLLGAAAVGTCLAALAVAGVRPTPGAFLATAAVLAGAGIAAALLAGPLPLRVPAPGPRLSPLRDAAATTCCFALVVVCAAALVGGFRSSPWLDDTWFFWVPKGIALEHLGLDARLFTEGATYVHFANPTYPLWWSIVTGLDLRLVGGVDLRAVNAELAVLGVAFVAAVARLLWGRVDPLALWAGLLVVAAAPDLLDQLQGGGADVPNAIFLVLAVAGALGWLLERETLGLALVVVFGAAAASTRLESAPELLVLLLPLVLLLRRRARGSFGALALAVVAALVAAAPWYAWQAFHRGSAAAAGSGGGGHGFHDRLDRLSPALGIMARELVDPRRWLLVAAAVVVLAVVLAVRVRRLDAAVPALIVAAGCLFWVVLVLASPRDAVGPSLRRTFDPVPLLAILFLPLLLGAVATVRRR